MRADGNSVSGPGDVRCAAAPGRVHPGGRDGCPGLEIAAVLVLVAADDEAIPPDAERLFASRMGATTVEVASSHVAMVSHPDEVAQVIKTAAEAVPAASPPD
jgi:pimeloyl-ACP methyl ester carboxylesterase